MTSLEIIIIAILFVSTILVIGKFDYEKKQSH
jgi:hypothetical protein